MPLTLLFVTRLMESGLMVKRNVCAKTQNTTEKPIKLYEWLLVHYAKPGERILDTHLGSGSICIAAHNLGFEMLGIELDPGYFNAAKQRLLYHQAQLKLF